MARITVDELLEEARARLERVGPAEASQAVAKGALLVDIRADSQREHDGVVPQALFFPRNVIEWRADPSSSAHDPAFSELDRPVVVMCDEGYQSSLVAATLQRLGFSRATDLVGGFQAWREAGLPVDPGRGDRVEESAG
jgi:rhodanese-related sulfurtransferase